MSSISRCFINGYRRALNIAGTKRWPDLSGSEQRDYEALKGDWDNVGCTIREETERFGEKMPYKVRNRN